MIAQPAVASELRVSDFSAALPTVVRHPPLGLHGAGNEARRHVVLVHEEPCELFLRVALLAVREPLPVMPYDQAHHTAVAQKTERVKLHDLLKRKADKCAYAYQVFFS